MNHKRLDIRLMLALVLVLLMVLVGAAYAQMPRPESCQEARDWGETEDGDYLILANGRYFRVYCYDMAGTPKEYLNLVNTGDSFNFAQYTAGGTSPGTDVRSNYTKVRINPQTLVVDIGDQTFTTSTGQLMHSGSVSVTSMPFGVAMGCMGGTPNGKANIDLRNTPFSVNDTFILGGNQPVGSSTFSAGDQVVNVTGGGYCGWNGPGWLYNPFNGSGGFQLDLSYINDNSDTERAALMSLYNSTGGGSWYENAGWDGTDSYCTWYGVTCNATGHVQNLDLAENWLLGPIPPQIEGLAALQVLDLSSNLIANPLPEELGNLAQLQILDLSDNEYCLKGCGRSLGGAIPASLGRLSNLQTLDLSGNVLEGAIPAELGDLAQLQMLDLSGNRYCTADYFTGEIICDGGLYGAIPAELSSLSILDALSLQSNLSLCWETMASRNWALTLLHYSGPTDCTYLPLLQSDSS